MLLGCTTGDDVGGEAKGVGDVVASRLSNDGQVGPVGEVLVDGVAQVSCRLLKERVFEPAPDVEEGKVVSSLLGHVEDAVAAHDGVGVDGGVVAAAADVEADTDDVEVEFTSLCEEGRDASEGRAELDVERAYTLAVVCEDTDDEFGVRMGACDLVELVDVVERHLVDAGFGCCADKGRGLAWVGEDDLGGTDSAEREDLVDLLVGRAVKAGAESSEKTEDVGIWVGFDGWKESVYAKIERRVAYHSAVESRGD